MKRYNIEEDAFICRVLIDTGAINKINSTAKSWLNAKVRNRVSDGIYEAMRKKQLFIEKTQRKFVTGSSTEKHSNFGLEQCIIVFKYVDSGVQLHIKVTERWINSLTDKETAALVLHRLKGTIQWKDSE